MVNALSTANVILPAEHGAHPAGRLKYNVILNNSPPNVEEFGQIPVKIVDGSAGDLGPTSRTSPTRSPTRRTSTCA